MTAAARRDQILGVGCTVFAQRGVSAATVEEIAAAAGVTKPVVYEHFGGKEGLYSAVVDSATTTLLTYVGGALSEVTAPRIMLERTVAALFRYISDHPDGFRVLVRDAPSWHSTGPLATLMTDLATHIEGELVRVMERREIDVRYAPVYAQMLVGMAALTGDWWLEHGNDFTAEEMAAHMVNLSWHGFTGLEAEPRLVTASETIAPDATSDTPGGPTDSDEGAPTSA